jgi:hypothetical protein
MSSVEKLVKAVEALKVFPATTINIVEDSNLAKLVIAGVSGPRKETLLTKKDKILNCNTV